MEARDNRKSSWVVTYGASKGYVTFQMFKDEGSLDVDEVHSTSDGSIVYTYIHLRKRSRISQIMQCMDQMKEHHGIIMSEVFGYDSISSNDNEGSLMNHIAFRMIYEAFKTNSPAFSSCTNGIPGVKKGLLVQFDGFSKIREVLTLRSKRLLPFLDGVESDLKKTKRELDQETHKADFLLDENVRLEQEVAELRRRNTDLEVKLIVDKNRRENDQMIQEALANFGNI